MTVTVRYFASIREAIGQGSEAVDTAATTLGALRDVSSIGVRGMIDLAQATLSALRHRRHRRTSAPTHLEPSLDTQ